MRYGENANGAPATPMPALLETPGSEAGKIEFVNSTKIPAEFEGEWGGTHGGMMRIGAAEVSDVLENRKYKITNVSIAEADSNTVLLTLTANAETGTYIKRLSKFKLVGPGPLYYWGYDSRDELNKDRYQGSAEFFKNE